MIQDVVDNIFVVNKSAIDAVVDRVQHKIFKGLEVGALTKDTNICIRYLGTKGFDCNINRPLYAITSEKSILTQASHHFVKELREILYARAKRINYYLDDNFDVILDNLYEYF